jgi:O-antigen/teichoic acid export membrane protein
MRQYFRVENHGYVARCLRLNCSFAASVYSGVMLVASTFLVNAALNFALGILIAWFLGPQGFGQYAIAASVAVVLNTFMLDWIRLAATRFYSDRTRSDDPAVRGTLDTLFVLSATGVILIAGTAIALGYGLDLPVALAALVPAMAICNGLYDYHTALARARFEDRTYVRLVIVRNLLALVLMVGGAWWFKSPTVVAAGLVVGLVATLLSARHRLVDPGVTILRPHWPSAGSYFLYGFPIIAAAGVYFLIPLWNRTAIATSLGFGASGEFSLAYDLTIRVVQTVGSALDILLFQLAVKAEEERGPEAGNEQLVRNMVLSLAVLTAVAAGYWLILPSIEALLVPPAFRQSFTSITTALLPGILCFALVQAAITPVFQLKKSTWPAIMGAGVAFILSVVLVGPWGWQPSLTGYATAQAVGYGAAFVLLAALSLMALKAVPGLKDMVASLLAVAAMIAAVWPIRGLEPGWMTLILSATAGAAIFAGIVWLANVGQCRALVTSRFR